MTKMYYRPMTWTWWLKNPNYTKFMVREVTSVFVALYLVTLLYFISRLPAGSQELQSYLERLSSPGWIAFHVIALFFALFHTVTWFNLTPKVMVIWRGEEKVPGWILAGGNYLVWMVISVAFGWFMYSLKG